ncbi:hypothetical protein BT69DRAFT_1333973 [Atractiella rhizophila]|nr:hypothetical protein BT69DRAFT_1333973 [Atractiella rhizophila]
MSPTPLTARDMLSLPRPSASLPNPSGTFYALAASTFNFDLSRTERALYVGRIPDVHIEAPELAVSKPNFAAVKVLDGLSILPSPVWLDDHTLIYLRPPYSVAGESDMTPGESDGQFAARNKGDGVEVWALKLSPNLDSSKAQEYLVGELPTAVSDLAYTSLDEDHGILSFAAAVGKDGDIYGVKELKAEKAKEKVGEGLGSSLLLLLLSL